MNNQKPKVKYAPDYRQHYVQGMFCTFNETGEATIFFGESRPMEDTLTVVGSIVLNRMQIDQVIMALEKAKEKERMPDEVM